jgi:outer membrane usher protein
MVHRRRAALLTSIAASLFLITASAIAAAAPATAAQAPARVLLDPPAPAAAGGPAMRLNPTKRTVTLAVTAKLGTGSLGQVTITIDPEDRVSFDAARILDLLDRIIDAQAMRRLRADAAARPTLTAAEFAAAGVTIAYDPQALELRVDVAAERRLAQGIALSVLDDTRVGAFVEPARVSAYLNVRGNLDYLHGDGGFASPVLYVDGAARAFGIVAESEAIWQPGAAGTSFNRLGSRLVYDDRERLVRWTAGDLQTVSRGFQSAPDVAGLSVFRTYSALQPQRIARPRGSRSFRLDRPATVEIESNGQLLRRLQLQPGNYDLRDFPFAQGANDVRLNILDDAGRRETIRFNLFLDQTQLAPGLSEFGLYAGVAAQPGLSGPNYSDDPAVTAFYRRGLSDAVTAGANVQADARTQMAGLEAIWASPLGLFSGTASVSRSDGYGAGFAANVTFQRLIQRADGRSDSLNLFAEARSAAFAALGEQRPSNPFRLEAGGSYSHAFSDSVYGGVDGRYSLGRGTQSDAFNVRGTIGVRLAHNLRFNGELGWQGDDRGRRITGLLSLTLRLDRRSSLRADYDTRFDRARLSYTSFSGQGVGALNLTADVERSRFGVAANGAATYFHNRAELGLSHFGAFDRDLGSSVSQRSSLRFGSSLAFADGLFSVGRPIHDGFAIVSAHRSLKGASVVLERNPFGHTADTGALGVATHPALSAYIERVVGIDAPSAPAGADLGQGTFRLLPPYRGGYRLQVGSDYSVTAVGRLLGPGGEPLALITGEAREVAHPERPAVAVFTNRDGRFGAGGLAPGRWRIVMNDDRRSTFNLDIPADAENIHRAGELSPQEGDTQ